jgi:hypothetical protein
MSHRCGCARAAPIPGQVAAERPVGWQVLARAGEITGTSTAKIAACGTSAGIERVGTGGAGVIAAEGIVRSSIPADVAAAIGARISASKTACVKTAAAAKLSAAPE